MGALDDIVGKVGNLFGGAKDAAADGASKAGDLIEQGKEKVGDLLNSDQAESISDKLLDGAADLANKVTGGKFEEQIEGVKDNLDGKIGNN